MFFLRDWWNLVGLEVASALKSLFLANQFLLNESLLGSICEAPQKP